MNTFVFTMDVTLEFSVICFSRSFWSIESFKTDRISKYYIIRSNIKSDRWYIVLKHK